MMDIKLRALVISQGPMVRTSPKSFKRRTDIGHQTQVTSRSIMKTGHLILTNTLWNLDTRLGVSDPKHRSKRIALLFPGIIKGTILGQYTLVESG